MTLQVSPLGQSALLTQSWLVVAEHVPALPPLDVVENGVTVPGVVPKFGTVEGEVDSARIVAPTVEQAVAAVGEAVEGEQIFEVVAEECCSSS